MKQLHSTVAAVLLALVACSLLGAFPHDHATSSEPASCQKAATHRSHQDASLESDGFHAGESSCAICFFQRVLSQAQVSGSLVGAPALPQAPLSVSSDSTVLVDVAFVAEPRAPPVT